MGVLLPSVQVLRRVTQARGPPCAEAQRCGTAMRARTGPQADSPQGQERLEEPSEAYRSPGSAFVSCKHSDWFFHSFIYPHLLCIYHMDRESAWRWVVSGEHKIVLHLKSQLPSLDLRA